MSFMQNYSVFCIKNKLDTEIKQRTKYKNLVANDFKTYIFN